MSIAMLCGALVGPRLSARIAPRAVVRIGLAAIALSLVMLVATIDVELVQWEFSLSLAVFGVGGGLLVSQLGNVIMSAVDQEHTNEAGGLQGMSQNLGASLGTALLGSVLLAGLTSGFVSRIEQNDALRGPTQDKIVQTAAASGLDVVPISDVRDAAKEAGLSSSEADAVAASYGDALLDALRSALSAGALIAVLGIALTAKLPKKAAGQAREAEPTVAPASPL
jgi:MFS family permease